MPELFELSYHNFCYLLRRYKFLNRLFFFHFKHLKFSLKILHIHTRGRTNKFTRFKFREILSLIYIFFL